MQNDNYVPKVGERCLLKFKYGNIFDATITYLGEGVGCFVDNDKGKEFTFATEAIEYFKALPTEEDKMVDELVEFFEELSTSARYMVGGNRLAAEELIKAGYRKVEPISFDLFVRIFNANEGNLEDFYYELTQGKHIIVKDGE